jgi:hypothetical protein
MIGNFGGEKMANLEKTIGLRLKVISYVGNQQFEREKTIFSIRELHKLLSKVMANKIVYGLSYSENCLILHLFIDRGNTLYSYEVNKQLNQNGGGFCE